MVSVAICALHFVNWVSYFMSVLYRRVMYSYLITLLNRILVRQPLRDSVSMRGRRLISKIGLDNKRASCWKALQKCATFKQKFGPFLRLILVCEWIFLTSSNSTESSYWNCSICRSTTVPPGSTERKIGSIGTWTDHFQGSGWRG